MTTSNDLLVLGAGDLGGRVARLWRTRFPTAKITCETRSTSRHADLKSMGCSLRVRRDPIASRFNNVILAVPPSQAKSYAAEAERASTLWDGKGTLLIISSTGVYAEESGLWVTEGSPRGKSPRALVLAAAEDTVLRHDGTVLRLAGLYSKDRGPQIVYLKTEASPLNGLGWINLIHYDDAASLAVHIMEKKLRGVFLGVDEQPLTRAGFVATIGSKCKFTGTETEIGKRCNAEQTRAAAGWKPEWKTFPDWWTHGGKS